MVVGGCGARWMRENIVCCEVFICNGCEYGWCGMQGTVVCVCVCVCVCVGGEDWLKMQNGFSPEVQ